MWNAHHLSGDACSGGARWLAGHLEGASFVENSPLRSKNRYCNSTLSISRVRPTIAATINTARPAGFPTT